MGIRRRRSGRSPSVMISPCWMRRARRESPIVSVPKSRSLAHRRPRGGAVHKKETRMTLDEALAGVDAVRPEIEAYRAAAMDMKVGATNEASYNPTVPTSGYLTEQIKTAGQ